MAFYISIVRACACASGIGCGFRHHYHEGPLVVSVIGVVGLARNGLFGNVSGVSYLSATVMFGAGLWNLRLFKSRNTSCQQCIPEVGHDNKAQY